MKTDVPMDGTTIISSAQNPKIKFLLSLRKGMKRREAGVLLVEGLDEISLAVENGCSLSELYFCRSYAGADNLDLASDAVRQGAHVYELTETLFDKVSYRQNPDGWLAVFPMIETRLEALSLPDCPLIIVCEALEKPGNLGAILRTADAIGVDAVISSEAVTDWANPNVARASRGALFTVPVAEASSEELIAWLRARDIQIVATSPDGAIPFSEADMTQPTAIVMGAEHQGLSAEWLEAADVTVLIPMQGKVNSLNVASSTALMIYEAQRQRAL